MTLPRTLLPIFIVCAAVAWLAGPVGRFIVLLPLLLFGPGYLLEQALGVNLQGYLSRAALWLGFSLSVVAILYEWATTLGLPLSTPVLQALTLACAVGVAVVASRAASVEHDRAQPTWSLGYLIALVGTLAATLWLRFVQIQSIVLPNWVDSVHHALMIRVTIERGFAPLSLRPYMPIDQLPYHWGYHVFTAVVVQLSGLPIPQVMLWEGQILNVLHVLVGAALATYLWRRPAAGIAAGAIIGLVSIMPAYYVSWGRYTQLAGLLLVPALAIVWREGVYIGARRWWLHAAVLLAGLSLIHFRVLVFALALIGVLSAVWVVWSGRLPLRYVRDVVLSAALALLLAGPWMLLLATRSLASIVAQPERFVSDAGYASLNTSLLWTGQNPLLVALAGGAALWGVRRRSLVAVEQIGWLSGMVVLANPWLLSYALPAAGAALLAGGLEDRRAWRIVGGGALLLVNPWLVRLPSSWLITNDVVSITLFLPLAMLVGGGISMLLDDWPRPAPLHQEDTPTALLGSVGQRWYLGKALLVVAFAAYAGWCAWDQRSIINDSTVLAAPGDVAAIQWVDANTPPDARFLINAAAWLPSADRGTDGGWWLLPLTGRWTSTPPVIADYGPPDYLRHARQVSGIVVGFHPGDEAKLFDMITSEGITYVYLGPKPGPLTPATFANNSRFQQVYERDGVTILAVRH